MNDSDGNGKKDYWRKDVAGLFGWVGPDGRRIELLDLAGALADDRPATSYGLPGKPAPVGGYWYRAIRHADEKTLDPHRFVICAYPDNYPCPARFTYVVDESNVIFRKDLGQGGGIEVFPEHPLEDGWIKSN